MFETKRLQKDYDYLAPDGSEITNLLNMKGGGLAHCTLPPNSTSLMHYHKTVDEIWYFIEGHGEVFRKTNNRDELVDAKPGTCITIPAGTKFQFRNVSNVPLCFIISTMPPWPGPSEAVLTNEESIWKIKSEQ
jgi:mannose-6-phosphate isomerase-like protein (cupin superfamily)